MNWDYEEDVMKRPPTLFFGVIVVLFSVFLAYLVFNWLQH